MCLCASSGSLYSKVAINQSVTGEWEFICPSKGGYSTQNYKGWQILSWIRITFPGQSRSLGLFILHTRFGWGVILDLCEPTQSAWHNLPHAFNLLTIVTLQFHSWAVFHISPFYLRLILFTHFFLPKFWIKASLFIYSNPLFLLVLLTPFTLDRPSLQPLFSLVKLRFSSRPHSYSFSVPLFKSLHSCSAFALIPSPK